MSALRRVGRVAHGLNDRAYLVGGVVRDALLGRRSEDLDVVIEGSPAALTEALAHGAVHHPAFHTATLTLPGGQRIDIARARIERYPRPGALPEVQPAALEQDLGRRDFTVNAMALSLAPRAFGRLVDPLGGIADLKRKRLRVLHERSFLDDPTRAFRAVRLAARLGFSIEPRTARLLRAAARGGAIDALSPARLRAQIELLFSELDPAAGLRLLARFGLLSAIDPDLRWTPPVRRRLAHLPALLRWYRALPDARPVESWLLALGALAVNLPARATAHLIARIAAGRYERAVLGAVALAPRRLLRRLGPSRARASRIHRVCTGDAPEILLLAMALAGSGPARRGIASYVERLARVGLDIDGRDLLRAGVAPGPRVARGLAAALRAKLDGAAPGRQAQLRVALRSARRA